MESKIAYLLSLQSIRDRAKLVWQVAQAGNLNHFDLHEDRLDNVADYVASVIKVFFILIQLHLYTRSRLIKDNNSEIMARISLIQFLLMVAGNTSRQEICLV